VRKIIILLFSILCLAFFLRLFYLTRIPIALHGDELGVGYNAYSLLSSGFDEKSRLLPISLRADSTPIFFYATLPSILFFGLSELATRLPSVLAGIITLLIFFLFVKELLHMCSIKKPNIARATSTKIALIALLLLCISPWHVQISRIVHDASYGLLFQLIGTVFFLKAIRIKKTRNFVISIVFFAISAYGYHSTKLSTPLLFFALCVLFKNHLFLRRRILFGSIAFLLMIAPMAIDFISKPLAQTRFGGINIFIRTADTSLLNSILPLKIGINYFAQLNPVYLFLDTSKNRYFNVSHIGLVYIIQILFLLLGIYFLRKQYTLLKFLFIWFAIAILPGALTSGPPNAGRVLMMLPIIEFVSAAGIYFFTIQFYRMNTKIISICFTILLILPGFYFFLYQYFIKSPEQFSKEWQYEARNAIQKTLSIEKNFDRIIITDEIKQAYIYVLFYGKKDSLWLKNAPKKRNLILGYDAIDKYQFRNLNWENDIKLKNALILTSNINLANQKNKLSNIIYENGEYSIFSTK